MPFRKTLDISEKSPSARRDKDFWRSIVAFWFFGLCNNYAYVIMLSAAADILSTQDSTQEPTTTISPINDTNNQTTNNKTRDCNELSTGAVLLADIIPTLVVKLTAPFFMQAIPYGIRNAVVIVFQTASYLIVAFSVNVPMSLAGVVCASFSSGLGEITYLSLGAHFDKDTISAWSSGTGGAGIFGALAYAGITQAGVSPRNTLLIMLIVPFIMTVCYWGVLAVPDSVYRVQIFRVKTWLNPKPIKGGESTEDLLYLQTHIPVKQKLQLVLPLLKYMIPLGLVYSGEYLINQGLQEFVVFPGIWLTKKDQYRWYQVLYQLGVFISRSSVNVVKIRTRFLIILPILQLANAALFFCEAYYLFIPSIWIVLVIILYEGLLGGAAYVNTFYQIRQEVDPKVVEYSLGVASVADSAGIVIAGFVSIFVHNWICAQPLP